MNIILISGKAGSGKDFLAEKIKEFLEVNYNLKGYVIHFADALKMVCTQIYKWDGFKGENGRNLLQTVGTDIAQKNNKTIWADIVCSIIKGFKSEFNFVIIPDARFRHEILRIRDTFNSDSDKIFTVRIYFSPNEENQLTDEQKQHSSETDLDKESFDFYFNNKSHNIANFYYQLYQLVEAYFKKEKGVPHDQSF